MPVVLSEQQRTTLQSYISAGNYALGYSYVATLVAQQGGDPRVAAWMNNASSVNANDGSFISEFVRNATQIGAAWDLQYISPAEFQSASDGLAVGVLTRIVADQQVADLNVILARDVSASVDGLGLNRERWAGTLGAMLSLENGGMDVMPESQLYIELYKNFQSRGIDNTVELYWKWFEIASTSVGAWTGAKAGQMLNALRHWTDTLDGHAADIIDKLTHDWIRARATVSPLIVDLDGDGVETLGMAQGIHFDHDANGAAERTGWVAKDDGLLVFDRNGNGLIDNGTELFGNNTSNGAGGFATNGFAALSVLNSNGDGIISSADANFAGLRVWKDANSNAVVDAGELLTLGAAGIQQISLTYVEATVTDENGNEHRQLGSFKTTGGLTRQIDDVWFREDLTVAVNRDSVEVSAAIEALPDVEALGNVRSLHVAMQLDATQQLTALVQQYASTTDATARSALVDQIIFKWTASDGIPVLSRGGDVNAKELASLEAFMGEVYIQGSGTGGGASNPGPIAAGRLNAMYDRLHEYVDEALLAQTHLKPILSGIKLVFNSTTTAFDIDVSDAVAMLSAIYSADPSEGLSKIKQVLYVAESQGGDILQRFESAGNINGTGFALALATLGRTLVRGGMSADTLSGGAGADMILGEAGIDNLSGSDGNDILRGGANDDTLSGGAGDDTYRFSIGDGWDTISNLDAEGYDYVELGQGITEAQVSTSRVGADLRIAVGGPTEGLTIIGFFNQAGGSENAIRGVKFYDGQVWGAERLFAPAPTEGNDQLVAYYAGSDLNGLGGNDTIKGMAGSDRLFGDLGHDNLFGAAGNDTLDGGDGNDSLSGDDGNDILMGGRGNDLLDGGRGSNEYIFRRGDGEDSILPAVFPVDGASTLRFTDLASTEVHYGSASGKLEVHSNFSATDSVSIGSTLAGDLSLSQVQSIVFSDGVAITLAEAKTRLYAGSPYDDYIRGTSGSDSISGSGGNDQISGEGGSDTLSGGEGNDTISGNGALQGDSGDDWLIGLTQNDQIDGGLGDDRLGAGPGNDTYLYARGDGLDLIQEFSGTDILQFKVGVAPTDISLYRLADDLIVVVDDGATQLTVQGHFTAPQGALNTSIESIQFANGTTWDAPEILSRVITGTVSSAVGSQYEDDTFVVDNPGDSFLEYAGTENDLVKSYYPWTLTYGTENLQLLGPLNISATGSSLYNIIEGNVGNNRIEGKLGRDYLKGGRGSDTYWFTAGDGEDVVDNSSDDGATTVDRIRWTGVDPAAVTFSRAADMLVMAAGLDRIGLAGFFSASGAAQRIDEIVFDNTVWSQTALWSMVSALPAQYSSGNDNISGSGLDDVIDGGTGADAMSGGLGNDTYFVDNANDTIVEAVDSYSRPAWTNGTNLTTFPYNYQDSVIASVSYALAANVENLTLVGSAVEGTGNELANRMLGNALVNTLSGGGGNDMMFGFAAADQLFGGDGNDKLDGGEGADTLVGGLGDDLYFVEDSGDTLVEAANEGYDQVQSTVSYVLSAEVEVLTLLGQGALNGTGNASNNRITGTSANNILTGGGGADSLDGGAGADTLVGGTGDDTYFVDNIGDVVIEASGEGTDGVSTKIDLTIPDNVESLSAAADGIRITGGAGNDVLSTGFSNVTIDGGAGNDSIRTNSGINETFIFGRGYGKDTLQNVAGRILFNADTLFTEVTVRRIGADLLIGINGTQDVITTIGEFGSQSNIDRVEFASGTTWTNAQLDAMGSAYVNQALTVGTPLSDMGAATGALFSYVVPTSTFADADVVERHSYSARLESGAALPSWLAFNPSLRTFSGTPTAAGTINIRVTGTDGGGATASDVFVLSVSEPNLTLTGTAGNDTLIGQGGNDTLDGLAGADQMTGNSGNDTYYVDNSGDVVTEGASQGTDSVKSTISYVLTTNVENLELLGTSGINGTGNASVNSILGNSGANTLSGGGGADSMTGRDGADTYVVDNTSDSVVELANEGVDLVQSSATYTLSANVENLTLTGTTAINGTGNGVANVLIGNSANNTLTGLSGDDSLDGLGGVDSLVGGAGDDTYYVDNAGDVTSELSNEGIDVVRASVSVTLTTNVENAVLTGTASINVTGNALANILTGNSAANSLDGGTGADTLSGGAGNDIYVVDNAGDSVVELANEGTDLVQTSVSYALAVNVENLTLIGTSAINGTGNAAANTLTGNSAANTLDGGAGNDTLIGGGGNDVYFVDSSSDVVTESASGGTDTINASVTLGSLAANVENLTLTGTTDLNGAGNTLANVLTGNVGNNTLDGGAGNDTLVGGAGNDIYVIDSTSDVVTEAANGGTDTIRSAVTLASLAANVENLTLTGTTAINGTGNALDNILIGNSANNTLGGSGGNDMLDGGAGTDAMSGGAGNDTYTVDIAADVTTENANEGTDLVQSAVTRTLGANIEMLFLTGTSGNSATGNTLANFLRGNSGINVLAGGGGTDILEGKDGNDTLSNSSGNTYLNGGLGTDTLTATSGNDILIGGLGNDALTTGAGADIIVFNKGEGADTVAVSTTKDNTIALGGGALYADLLFQKSGNDLILKVGASDQITFSSFYASTANRSVSKLQIVIEGTSDYVSGSSDQTRNRKIETFNFDGLVSAFDAARTSNPSITTWALTNALAAQFLAGSDTAAIGGDLAYRYNRFGTLGDMSFTPALGILGNAGFGAAAQTLQTLTSLQDTTPRLS